MNRAVRIATLASLAFLGACATAPKTSPVDVTRFHLGKPMEVTTIAVEAAPGNLATGLEYQTYADAVTAELGRIGYVLATSDRPAGYVAQILLTHRSLGTVRKRAPVTIGLGGGSFGGNVGVGGGASFGIGGGTAELVGTELLVQLRRRSDNSVVWEGRAMTQDITGKQGPQTAATAQRLATALFKGFPGESGITITVK